MTTSCPVAAEPKRRVMTRFLAPALVFAAIASSPAVSHAGDPAAAEALFQTAKGLMDKKDYNEACPKFEASYRLDPAVGTMLNLADCLEKQGKLAKAWVSWGDARDQAKKEGDQPRADLAARRQKELDPRVPRLSVTVKGDVGGLAVYRDDIALEPASFGVPLPVDPGKHAITLRRGTNVLKEQSVDSKEKAKDEVTLDATDVPPPPPEATSDDSQPKHKTIMVRRSKGLMAGGIVLSVLGGFTLLGGLVMLVPRDTRGAGAVVSLIGAGATAGGIAMAVSGSKKVPKTVEVSQPTLFIGPTSIMFQTAF